MSLSRLALASLVLGATILHSPPARAYPIDCAILLCLAGGFPASAECSSAKLTMIRRITPWPVSPPLQLWNCPFGLPTGFTAAPGSPGISLGPDGLTDEVRGYRDAIEIYHIRTFPPVDDEAPDSAWRDHTQRGTYLDDGSHRWVGASLRHGPAWLAESDRVRRVPIQVCTRETDNGCWEWRVSHYENWPAGGFLLGYRPVVAIRYEDFEGNKHTEFVNY
ncbi:hypothetical protein [Roseinatronobacter alkalisoli]|uniref:Uncharacterized protein n=1 Tax=Roseinatronobacter alkalisoli TaxID=3028235 RepID=A0ABT5TA51_9RHOB|nr:hypothetical protein [Roseinatronobacter sp. HJB301]MDD7971998.1 hypothetical protein [Roseinatronobacter sp. HJB301]